MADCINWIRSKVGHDKIILVFAGGCLFDGEGKVLLQKRGDSGKWGFPGGAIELGETPEETAIRELKEETGLDVELLSFLGIYHNHEMVWGNGDCAHTIGAYYLAKIVSGDLQMDEESLELRFFKKKEIPELFAEDHRAAVDAYLRGIRYPLFEENSNR